MWIRYYRATNCRGYSFSGPPAVDPPETGEYDATTQGLKNDLWRFSLADGNWTQIDAGSDADDRKRRPSPRVHHAASYDEEADRLYVFGGTAAYSYKVSHSDFSVSWEFPESAFQSCGLSDVWAYDFGRKRWLLVAGEEEVEPCDVTAIAAGQEGGGAASLRAGGVALLALALASTAAAVA